VKPQDSSDGYFFTVNLAVSANTDEEAQDVALQLLQDDQTLIDLVINPLDIEFEITGIDTFADTAPIEELPLNINRYTFRPMELLHSKPKKPPSPFGDVSIKDFKNMFEQFSQEFESMAAEFDPSEFEDDYEHEAFDFDQSKPVKQHLHEAQKPAFIFSAQKQQSVQDYSTKLRGTPWWPKGKSRPLDSNAEPMQFIGQINLSDLSDFANTSGTLVIHMAEQPYAPNGDLNVLVNFFAHSIEPDNIISDAESHCLNKIPLKSLPDLSSSWADGLSRAYYGDDDNDEFYPIYQRYQQIDFESGPCGGSFIGGYPQWWQDPEEPLSSDGEPMKFVGYLGMLEDGVPVENMYIFADDSNPSAPLFSIVFQGT